MLQLTPEFVTSLRRQLGQFEERQRRKVEAAPQAPARKLNAKRFERLVDDAVFILRAGVPTKFEYEGACRHGLRASLILDDWRWSDADGAAAEIVAAGLHRLGAERPTWMEGQRDFPGNVDLERYYCSRCGTPMPDERREGGYHAKFCSDVCKRAAVDERARLSGERVSRAEHLAKMALKSEERLLACSGDCQECGRPVITQTAGRLFCSLACSARAQRKYGEKPCAQCETLFRPKSANIGKASGQREPTRFCSSKCYGAAKAKHIERACPVCRTVFKPLPSSKRVYCSAECNVLGRRAVRESGMRCEGVG